METNEITGDFQHALCTGFLRQSMAETEPGSALVRCYLPQDSQTRALRRSSTRRVNSTVTRIPTAVANAHVKATAWLS